MYLALLYAHPLAGQEPQTCDPLRLRFGFEQGLNFLAVRAGSNAEIKAAYERRQGPHRAVTAEAAPESEAADQLVRGARIAIAGHYDGLSERPSGRPASQRPDSLADVRHTIRDWLLGLGYTVVDSTDSPAITVQYLLLAYREYQTAFANLQECALDFRLAFVHPDRGTLKLISVGTSMAQSHRDFFDDDGFVRSATMLKYIGASLPKQIR